MAIPVQMPPYNFRVERAENGGWVILSGDRPEFLHTLIGAYSNTKDLLAGISTYLGVDGAAVDPTLPPPLFPDTSGWYTRTSATPPVFRYADGEPRIVVQTKEGDQSDGLVTDFDWSLDLGGSTIEKFRFYAPSPSSKAEVVWC